MERSVGAGVTESPQTGVLVIDEAVAGLADLRSLPVAEHHQRLAEVHETLHVALSSGGAQDASA